MSRLLRFPEVARLTGLSRATIWRRENATPPTFPIRVALGDNAVAWREDEILEWIANRPRRGRP